jgi:Cu-Zn family superoxide dismutase
MWRNFCPDAAPAAPSPFNAGDLMRSALSAIAILAGLSACMTSGTSSSNSANQATAQMRDAAGNSLGTLTITETGTGLLTTGTLRGLAPGTHGIHLHAVGRCEPPFASAGGHWNPTARQHGVNNPMGPHLGDMMNIDVAADGSANVSVRTPGGTLRGTDALLDSDGAAIVVHASADDYRTDPAGNSGARVACGVVQGS